MSILNDNILIGLLLGSLLILVTPFLFIYIIVIFIAIIRRIKELVRFR
jgi:hypothetical protein